MPGLYEGRWELSTYCLDGLQGDGVWSLLDLHSDRPVVGRSDLLSAAISEFGLRVDPNWDPERHVNVIGWPAAEEERKSLSQALHAKQSFLLRSAQ